MHSGNSPMMTCAALKAAAAMWATVAILVLLATPLVRAQFEACDTPQEQQGAQCQAICNCDCSAPDGQLCNMVCQHMLNPGANSWCNSGQPPPSPPSNTVDLFRHELGAQYLDIGGRALDGSPAMFHYRAPPGGRASTKWVIYLQGGGSCETNADCFARTRTYRGSSRVGPNLAPTLEFSTRGIFGESAYHNPGFWDAHKVYVSYLSGDLFAGTRTESYTFPSDPNWGNGDSEPTNSPQPEFYFSGHLNLVHIVNELSTNSTFTANGGGLGSATDVILTGCSAGGYGVRLNADWLLDTLPTGINFRAAPAAALGFHAETTWLNYQAGIPGGQPIVRTRPDGVPNSTELWSIYANPTSLDTCMGSNASWTDDEARSFCYSNVGIIASFRTPMMHITNQFDTRPIMSQYLNESDFTLSDASTPMGQQYLAYWGAETRRFLIDHVQYAFAPSCFDHCNLTPLAGGPSVNGTQALEILTDWFFGNDTISHKMIEGVGADGVDRHPLNGLPFNPACSQTQIDPESTTAGPRLPEVCDTVQEQQSAQCQQICNCDCTGGGQGGCQTICRLHNGPQSIPWCQDSPMVPQELGNITVQTDVVFMTAFGQDFALDIYSNENADVDQPLALVIHGGGFVGGDKADRNTEAMMFAERGFRVVSINYPLCKNMFDHTTGALHPWNATSPTDGNNSLCLGVASGTDNLPDEIRGTLAEPAMRAARLAIKYMHTGGRAAQHRVDTSKTVCHGTSAGALTCYATLFWNTTISNYPNITNAMVPQPDLDQYGINVAAACAGGLTSGDRVTQETVDAMMPGAAVWDLHGDADLTVPVENSNTMMDVAEQWGIPHGQVIIPGGGHGISGYLRNMTIQDEMFTFIFDNLQNAGGPLPVVSSSLATTELPTSSSNNLPANLPTVESTSPEQDPSAGQDPSSGTELPTSSSNNQPANLPTVESTSPEQDPSAGQDPSSGQDASSGGDGDDGDSSMIIIIAIVISLIAVGLMVIGAVVHRRRAGERDTEALRNHKDAAYTNPVYGYPPDNGIKLVESSEASI